MYKLVEVWFQRPYICGSQVNISNFLKFISTLKFPPNRKHNLPLLVHQQPQQLHLHQQLTSSTTELEFEYFQIVFNISNFLKDIIQHS